MKQNILTLNRDKTELLVFLKKDQLPSEEFQLPSEGNLQYPTLLEL